MNADITIESISRLCEDEQMIRCFYTAGTGMLVQRDRMDVLANNLTNVDTTAYKSDALISGSFKDLLIQRLHDPNGANAKGSVGPLGTGAHIDRVHTSFEQGGLEQTDRALDLALDGDGFFTIAAPQGQRYTRDGSFAVSGDGYLVTSEGWYVQGENGRIQTGGDDFAVDGSGNITNAAGETLAKLRIVSFDDLSGLRKEGGNLYENASAGPERATPQTKVIQGWLEGSNVDVTTEITRLLTVSKAYQTNQRVFGIVDSSLEKTVNEVGRV